MSVMQTAPDLTDTTALARNRRRAARAPVHFLMQWVADDLQERLIEVNRSFRSVAIVTGFPGFWRERFPDATIVADDPTLGLETGAHDLVIHALALHWSNDPVGQLVQSRHALRPDGMVICALLGGQTLHELRVALAHAEVAVTGGLSPRVAPMGELRDLGALLQRAGLALPVADSQTVKVSYPDPLNLMQDLRGMGEGNALAARLRRPTRRRILTNAVESYRSVFAQADGRVPATFEVITLTGWAPSADQQQPLRPGSATHRLAEVLRSLESPLAPEGN